MVLMVLSLFFWPWSGRGYEHGQGGGSGAVFVGAGGERAEEVPGKVWHGLRQQQQPCSGWGGADDAKIGLEDGFVADGIPQEDGYEFFLARIGA